MDRAERKAVLSYWENLWHAGGDMAWKLQEPHRLNSYSGQISFLYIISCGSLLRLLISCLLEVYSL